MDTVAYRQTNVVAGAVWILVLSLLLFWLPVAGPLIAGFVGGKKAGGVAAGIVAVFLPAIVLGMFFFVFGTVITGLPLLGIVAGTGSFIMTASGVGLLLVGAIVGGLCVDS